MINVAALHAEHARILRRHEHALEFAGEIAGRRGVNEASENTGFVSRSGKLAAGNRYKLLRRGGKRIVRLINRVKYAAPIDKGSKPHVIKAKGDGYLHFKGKNGWVRTRSVNHPGNKPFHFLRNAAGDAYTSYGDAYRRLMRPHL